MLSACAAPIARPTSLGPVGKAGGRWRQQAHWIPVWDADGTSPLLYAHVCRPEGSAPARVVVLNHGTGPDRPIVQPYACDGETPEWFLRRGFLVVSPIRRGYGVTGGAWSENLAVGSQGVRRCDDVDPYRQALETAREIAAAVNYPTALPGARPDGAVVVGISTGGYGTIAYASQPHPKMAALVNVSGGRGGRIGGGLGQVCHADCLVEAAGCYGAAASTPMLWLYATNDGFFSPDLGRAMHAAFAGSGGQAEFVETGVFGYDGHGMLGGLASSQRLGAARRGLPRPAARGRKFVKPVPARFISNGRRPLS